MNWIATTENEKLKELYLEIQKLMAGKKTDRGEGVVYHHAYKDGWQASCQLIQYLVTDKMKNDGNV